MFKIYNQQRGEILCHHSKAMGFYILKLGWCFNMLYWETGMHTILAIFNVINDCVEFWGTWKYWLIIIIFLTIGSIYDFGIKWVSNLTNLHEYIKLDFFFLNLCF